MQQNHYKTAAARMLPGTASAKPSPAHSRVFVMMAGLILGLGTFIGQAHAGVISGTFTGDSTLTPTGTPGVFIQNFSGDGLDPIFGPFTPVSQSTIDFSNPPNIFITNGILSETFTNGTLIGTSSGSGTASGTGTATITVNFLITGGTGDFAGFTGEATLTGTITQTSPTTESIAGTYLGSISATPEPSTLLLLAAGLTGCVIKRRRSAWFRG